MKQRTGIAMALALDPAIVILDEPTTALDVLVQRQILTLLLELRERYGFSVIFTTHDLSLLLEICDTIAIMRHGELVEYAAADDVHLRPKHEYTRELLDSLRALGGWRSDVTDNVVLEARGLVKDFGRRADRWFGRTGTFRAVDDVSFQLQRGQMTARWWVRAAVARARSRSCWRVCSAPPPATFCWTARPYAFAAARTFGRTPAMCKWSCRTRSRRSIQRTPSAIT
nr:AAA family ATPase [Fodinicola feengrottensis]